MVFVCPPKEETETKVKLLNNLKNAIVEMEKSSQSGVSPICLPCYVPLEDISICMPSAAKPKESVGGDFCPPNVMVSKMTVPELFVTAPQNV
ncbi:unnamed protein product [Acanthoscelides obtectus]|uniref:Uncharacterized protein n=1 Tax=Acanthoscelides obtectus TaxID=200917 RepID=A0A9P0P9F0_ACAOB|nr:unnamed protein product [Acanthoscelides obtectus]CAK1646330.1 hypothetical protein AOBTE_LOCUS14590 [Acanthoscelides obtectus]